MKEKNEYDEEFDNDDFDNDDFGEENEKVNPLVATGVFLGLIFVAAVICVVLWSATHKSSEEVQLAETVETMQEKSGEEDTIDLGTLEAEVVDDEAIENEAVDIETEVELISGNETMAFAEVDDTVTSKDVTNLRSQPSTADSENVVGQLLNGETLSRTGINEDTGWSRIDYNGQIVYAVSTYLTTDLEYTTPVEQTDSNRITTQDGRVIIFTDCDDYVRPKEYVNLRTEPSTSQGESTVKCRISHADIVHRTGYSEDSGWSRVEFYGEVLYVVSSYVYNAEATE